MLGVRGARLGVLRPELYRAQAKAVAEAVCPSIGSPGRRSAGAGYGAVGGGRARSWPTCGPR